MWVSLLAFEYLKDIIDEVYYDITEVYNNTLDHRSNLYRKKIRCILCDDCAYTGSQLSYIASFDYTKVKYPHKPPAPDMHNKEWLQWYKRINIDAELYVKSILANDFSVDVIVPYMSILAKTRLHRLHYVKISSLSIVFPIFSQQLDMERIPVHSLNEFKRTFQYHKDISAIYFDHKIADSMSTFHKVYMLAPLFNCTIQNKRVGFIDNCNEEKIPDNINIYDHYMDVEVEMGSSACPPSFYKHIAYTFRKKLVDPTMYVFNLFDEKDVHIRKQIK
jgi:hypothetical protein